MTFYELAGNRRILNQLSEKRIDEFKWNEEKNHWNHELINFDKSIPWFIENELDNEKTINGIKMIAITTAH